LKDQVTPIQLSFLSFSIQEKILVSNNQNGKEEEEEERKKAKKQKGKRKKEKGKGNVFIDLSIYPAMLLLTEIQ
jgi:hypothetical protein